MHIPPGKYEAVRQSVELIVEDLDSLVVRETFVINHGEFLDARLQTETRVDRYRLDGRK